MLFVPAFGQTEQNPTLEIETIEISFSEFNKVSRDSTIIPLNQKHEDSWQLTIKNDLMYTNPDGNAVLRLYDSSKPDHFLEIGMGAPPNDKFWAALQDTKHGYVIIRKELERGWVSGGNVIMSYTKTSGMTVNNGARIVVSNLDIDIFTIDSYSVHGMESLTDPPATNSGQLRVEFISGDPKQNILHMYPFVVTAVVGGVIALLLVTKKRSS